MSRSAWNRVDSAQSIWSSEKHVDIVVDDEDVLHVAERTKRRGDGIARLARHTLAQRDPLTLYMPPDDAVQQTATGSRTADCSAFHTAASVFAEPSCEVSVRLMLLPPMVTVWNSASLRRVIAVR